MMKIADIPYFKHLQYLLMKGEVLFKCFVCKKSFTDPFKHLDKNQDKAHLDYDLKICMRETPYCFCGNQMGWHDTYEGYEDQCHSCGFIGRVD